MFKTEKNTEQKIFQYDNQAKEFMSRAMNITKKSLTCYFGRKISLDPEV